MTAAEVLGLSVGIVATDVAFRVLAPELGGPRRPTPSPRLIGALGSIFGGPVLLVLIARTSTFAHIPSTSWENAFVACAISHVWGIATLFACLTSGAAHATLRYCVLIVDAVLTALIIGAVGWIIWALSSGADVPLIVGVAVIPAAALMFYRWFERVITWRGSV